MPSSETANRPQDDDPIKVLFSIDREQALLEEVRATYAQIAYQAYGAAADWKTFDGRQMPSWYEVGPDIQSRWVNGVFAAILAYTDQHE